MPGKLHTTQPAAAVVDWLTVLRAAETLKFSRVVPWGDARITGLSHSGRLWFVEFAAASGRLCRDIVLDGDEVRTVEDADV